MTSEEGMNANNPVFNSEPEVELGLVLSIRTSKFSYMSYSTISYMYEVRIFFIMYEIITYLKKYDNKKKFCNGVSCLGICY